MRAASLLSWVLAGLLAAPAQAQTLWREARHGMTKGDVSQAFRGLVPDRSQNLVPCFFPAVFRLPGIRFHGADFQALFHFNETGRLYEVVLRSGTMSGSGEARELFNTICKDLLEKHGEPPRVYRDDREWVTYEWSLKEGLYLQLSYLCCNRGFTSEYYVALAHGGPYQF